MSGRRRLLLVDDDPSVRDVLERLLGQHGYDVRTASNGHEARAMLGEAAFDLVVSDISMPGLGGVELLKAVRERDLDLPVILVTGSPSVETAIRAVQYGASRYLTKPVDPKALLDAVDWAAKVHQLARLKREALEAMGAQQQLAADLAGLEAAFEAALRSLTMSFQPIVSCSRRAVFAYEALARPNDPRFPSPPALIGAAERLGRLPDLGRTIRQRVATDIAPVVSQALILVNLHPHDLVDDQLFDGRAPLSKHAARVVLEITERASLHDIGDVHARLGELRKLGYRFALDDLGAGYAGLTSFVQMNPEVVKLDMELIRDVHQSDRKERVIRSMNDLCRDMKIEVVAEGVENRQERDALSRLGIDLLQGYVFARPQREFVSVAASAFD